MLLSKYVLSRKVDQKSEITEIGGKKVKLTSIRAQTEKITTVEESFPEVKIARRFCPPAACLSNLTCHWVGVFCSCARKLSSCHLLRRSALPALLTAPSLGTIRCTYTYFSYSLSIHAVSSICLYTNDFDYRSIRNNVLFIISATNAARTNGQAASCLHAKGATSQSRSWTTCSLLLRVHWRPTDEGHLDERWQNADRLL